MEKVLLSLGTNLGDRREIILKTINYLREKGLIENIRVSKYYETEPVGYLDQPWFLNIALTGETSLDAEDLLFKLKNAERQLGRKERGKWKEREIDIDILLFGEISLKSNDIEIPHPRMQDRMFVLKPAADIAGEMMHPILKKKIDDLLSKCTDNSIVKPYPESE
jgi:2-amino-4-hydroxy-6-hydroxymethyldihydropteridine diphosphokinase